MGADANSLEKITRAVDRPVCYLQSRAYESESRSLGVERKVGGKLHLKLNICLRPIANKNCEGKMQRALKREIKMREIAGTELDQFCFVRLAPGAGIRMSVSALLFALSVRTSSLVN